jgi:hypothetical protein
LFKRLIFSWYFQATSEANNLAAKSVSKEFYIRAMEQVKINLITNKNLF